MCLEASVKYARKCILCIFSLYGFPCEIDFSPPVSEFQPRRKQLGWDSETYGEKNQSHMEDHTKYI